MVGRDQCLVLTIADTVITCIAPQRDEPILESVIVSHSHMADPGGSYGCSSIPLLPNLLLLFLTNEEARH